jgi:preprotein translocase subunit SecG
MQTILLVVQILAAIGLIALILVQHGRGADAGAAFGSGASGSLFGSRGPTSFLTRSTAVLATVFFVNSLALAYLASHTTDGGSVIERVQSAPEQEQAPGESDPASSDIPSVPKSLADDIPEEDMTRGRSPTDVPDPPPE